MIWQIILLIVIFLLIIPIPIKVKLSFNILRLSGEVFVRVLKIFKIKVRVRFRGSYVYVSSKKKTKREKLTSKNYNVVFLMQFIRQLYFRIIFTQLEFMCEVGYYNDALTTALGSGVVDIVSKGLSARILHNKKSAHIFINNEAKYNQDCLNMKLECQVKISLFDVIYTIVNTLWSIKGEQYERNSTRVEQDQEFD